MSDETPDPTPESTESKDESHSEASESKPETSEAKSEKKPKTDAPAMVTLKNRLPQSLTVTLRTENGMDSLKLGPRGNSVPVPKDSLTPYTHRLIECGHVTPLAVK